MKLISRQKVSQQIFDYIKSMIEEGELKPGDNLPTEEKLTEMFEVSRTPVREALSILEASRLVKSTQGGGRIVQETSLTNFLEVPTLETVSLEQVLQLIEVRMALEPEAARYAALRRSEEDLSTIEREFFKNKKIVQNKKDIGHEEDFAFHSSIVDAAHNPILRHTMLSISNLFYKSVKFSLKKNMGYFEKKLQILEEHEEIYNNIKAKDSDLASKNMFLHLRNAKQKLEKYKQN